MPNTFHDPDNDPSCRRPQAWRKTKLAFGWKPRLRRRGCSGLVKAMLDLEEHARKNGGCVRLMLELAIRNYLRLPREQKRQAAVTVLADYDRSSQAARIDRDFREAMRKCGMPDEPDNAAEE